MSDSSLLADLDAALIANRTVRRCDACQILAEVSDEARGPLASAMAGTIGRDKLVAIMARNGYSLGRRAIERHRQEGHTP